MARGFRPQVIEQLRKMRAWHAYLLAAWQAPSSTWYDAGDGRGIASNPKRSRSDIPAAEFPEHNPQRLRELVGYMESVEAQARIIRQAAQNRLMQLEEQQYLDGAR
jgi:hypothetical protein